MSDILAVQEFLFKGLLSCDLFASYNVVLEREFLAQSEIEFNAIWQMPRVLNGPSGIGMYVEMPKLQVPKPNSLQRNLVASIAVIEERNINMTAGAGTGMSAEDLSELALDFMFGWMMGLSSGLTPEVGAVAPATDLVQGDGLVTYRASVSLRREHHAVARCDQPTITEGPSGVFTLTNGAGTPDAEIWVTTATEQGDLGLPGKANTDAVKYAAALALPVGSWINFAAWRGDRLPSHISVRKIT